MTAQITWTEGSLDTYTFPCVYIKIYVNTYMCTYVYMHTQEMAVQSAPTESGLDVYTCLYMYVNICEYIHIYIYIYAQTGNDGTNCSHSVTVQFFLRGMRAGCIYLYTNMIRMHIFPVYAYIHMYTYIHLQSYSCVFM